MLISLKVTTTIRQRSIAIPAAWIFGVHRAAADHLNDHKEQPPAIQSRNGKEIEDPHIDGEKGHQQHHRPQPQGRRLAHHRGGPHRAGQLAQPIPAGENIHKGIPHLLDDGNGPFGGILKAGQRGLLHPIEGEPQLDRPAAVLIGFHFKGHLIHLRYLAVSHHLEVDHAVLVPQQLEKGVVVPGDVVPVDAGDPVAALEILGRGNPLIKTGNHGGTQQLLAAHQPDQDAQAQQNVHRRACKKNDKPLPRRFPEKGSLVVAVLALPFHGHIPADGKEADGVFRLPFYLLEQQRAHPEGKLVDPYPKQLGKEKMPRLMDVDNNPKDQYGNQNGNNYLHIVTPIPIKINSRRAAKRPLTGGESASPRRNPKD